MRIPRFELERWQSVWENLVELNISESGILPLSVHELVPDAGELQRLLDVPLGYPQSNGSEEVRTQVAGLYPGARAENVLMASGCAEANFLVTWGLVEPGDEVVFMQPNYMQVIGVAQAFGATVKPLWLREELRWSPDLDDLRRLVTPRTRLIAICNPSNPTGAVLSESAMNQICEAAAEVGAYVLADEVYRGAELAGDITPTFWGRYERVLCTAGLSKAFSLPGLRTGWVVAQPEMAERLWSCKDYTTIGISMLSDRLAAYALTAERRAWIRQRAHRILNENYPVVREWVNCHPDTLTHVPPTAGAIAWIGYGNGKAKAGGLAEDLRAEKSVLIVPGDHAGLDSYVRVGFGYHQETLARALQHVDEVLFRTVPA
jgi:aspartate/methionine/tyrosine aminotransferase